jgi:DNA ligase-associated metallophosphoesterase
MMPFSPKPLTSSLTKPCPSGASGLSRHHKITLSGISFLPHHSGALFAPDHHTLLIADLHLEQGASLARRGIHVPPFDTATTISLLEQVISETKPWRLVLLGDSFHDGRGSSELPQSQAERLLRVTSEIETIWISGNHDPHPPQGLGGIATHEHSLEHIFLRHQPSKRVSKPEIAGHLHPGATIVQRGVATRGKCFVADGQRIILPAFGAYTGALGLRSPAFANMFDEASAQVWMIGRSAIHRFPMARVD